MKIGFFILLTILILMTACTPLDETNIYTESRSMLSQGKVVDYTNFNTTSPTATATIGKKSFELRNNISVSSDTLYSVIMQPSPSKVDTLKVEVQAENYNLLKNVSLVGTMDIPKGYTGHFEFNTTNPSLIKFVDGYRPNISWSYATKYDIVSYNETDENESNTTYFEKVFKDYVEVKNLPLITTTFFDKEAYLDPDVTQCGLINASGVYNLTNMSIINYAGSTCFNIYTSNVVFDCMGGYMDGIDGYGYYGFRIQNGTNISAGLSNVTVKNCFIHDFGCIVPYSMRDSFLYNIDCNSSYDGGFPHQGTNLRNNYYNITVRNNYNRGYAGIVFGGSYNNFTNISMTDVGKGFHIGYGSVFNRFTNSSIINSSGPAIYMSSSVEQNNYFSNILLNNTLNYLSGGTINVFNFYNITSYSGTNIIGGSIIAGNFWGLPNGTGYSDTCADADVNGICDVPYNVTSNTACVGCKGRNIDEMPLTYITGAPPDNVYAQITNIQDNNGSFIDSGFADINATITSSNGTGFVSINGLRYYMTNVSDFFNASIPLTGGVWAYNITAFGNGTSHLVNNSETRYFTVNQSDQVYPYFINQTDNNATLINNGTAIISSLVYDTNSSVYANFSGTLYLMSNVSNLYSVNFTVTSGVYIYYLFSYGTGASHNFNQTIPRVYQVNTSDTIFPLFGEESSNNATMYADGIANFSIPVNNTNNSVYLNINGNRYRASNVSNVYNVSIFLTNGTFPHFWDSFGNGTNNNSNVSVTRDFIIFPIQNANATLKLNGVENNLSGTYNLLINASFTNASGNATLYRNGASITSLNNQFENLSAGYYNYTLQVEGSHDYLGINISRFANISKATPVITKALNGVDANLFVTYPTTVNASGSTSYGNLTIYMDGEVVENGQAYSLSVGTYFFEWNVTGDENYTDISESLYATVNPVGTLGNDMVLHNFWGSDQSNRICLAFYLLGSEVCFNETIFTQMVDHANWSQTAADALYLPLGDQRYNDTTWANTMFYNKTTSDGKYAILDANNVFSGNNTIGGHKTIFNGDIVEFGVSQNITVTSGDLITQNLYVQGNLTYTTTGSLSVNNSLCIFDLSGDCQVNLSVTGVNGNIWASNRINATTFCLQSDGCLSSWQGLNQTSALASVGNWTLDKPSYSTTAQIANATIIRATNTTWIVTTANASGNIYNWNGTGYIKNWNASGNIYNWNGTGYIKDWNGIVNSTSWNRNGTNVVLANTGNNVGIGTISPVSKLDVNGTINSLNGLVVGTGGYSVGNEFYAGLFTRNLLAYGYNSSETFNSWGWNPKSGTITDEFTVADTDCPAPNKKVSKWVAAAGGSNAAYNLGTVPAGKSTFTFSFWARGNVGGETISQYGISTWSDWSNFASGSTITLTTNWKRYSVTGTANSGNNTYVYLTQPAGTTTIYLWGAQLENGSVAGAYQETTANTIYAANSNNYGMWSALANFGGTVQNPNVVIDSSGNVGIGTTSPGYNLENAGTSQFTGETGFGSTSYTTGIAITAQGGTYDFFGLGSSYIVGSLYTGGGITTPLDVSADQDVIASRDVVVGRNLSCVNTGTIGWTVQYRTNTACSTTCVNACVTGMALSIGGNNFVNCTDAAADSCLCAGGN